MIAAYPLIWSAYGCWLPNDPRGSSSQVVREDILKELGELHYGRKKIQPAGREIRQFYEKAKDLLHHELLTFTDGEIDLLAECFAETIKSCLVAPDWCGAIGSSRDLKLVIGCERRTPDTVMRRRRSRRSRLSLGGLSKFAVSKSALTRAITPV